LAFNPVIEKAEFCQFFCCDRWLHNSHALNDPARFLGERESVSFEFSDLLVGGHKSSRLISASLQWLFANKVLCRFHGSSADYHQRGSAAWRKARESLAEIVVASLGPFYALS
jgi:hypothetical protein